MVRESVLQYKASLQGDFQEILQASGEDYPIKDKFRERVLGTAYISVGIIAGISLVLATGFGFLIMIL